jgi:hypothetical protein
MQLSCGTLRASLFLPPSEALNAFCRLQKARYCRGPSLRANAIAALKGVHDVQALICRIYWGAADYWVYGRLEWSDAFDVVVYAVGVVVLSASFCIMCAAP